MNEQKKLLKQLKSAYKKQFDSELDPRFLNHVVEKELQKKRESFLQIQFASLNLGTSGLLDLKNMIGESTSRILVKKKKNKGFVENEQNKTEKKLAKVREKLTSSRVPEINCEEANEEEASISSLSEEEQKKMKRRAYAREYYHKKKENEQGRRPRPAKRFKTSPEQRAYQRAYYKRRKSTPSAELVTKGLEVDLQSKNTLFKEDNFDRASSTRSDAIEQKRSHLSFDRLEEDRTAIERAFSPTLGDSSASFKFPESGEESMRLKTKTKLRKNKTQNQHSS